MTKLEKTVEDLLQQADIKVGGNRPHDITVHNPALYARVLTDRELGVGEAYMDGWWTCDRPDEAITKLITADLASKVKVTPSMIALGAKAVAKAKLTNRYTLAKSKQNAEYHYNIGNDLYELMLDKRMQYTCAYWKGAKNLELAQENKLELVCQKLKLKKGMTLLELGCG